MDRITKSYLDEFVSHRNLKNLPEDKQFEHFAAFIATRRHLGASFDTADIVTGSSGDGGIDAVAILANGVLITDVDVIEEYAQAGWSFDVTFVFVQAERSASFDSAKIGQFHFGVTEFFKDKPVIQQTDSIKNAASIMAALYRHGPQFRPGNPSCELYYITTGKWQGDPRLEARRQAAVSDLSATGLFRSVNLHCVDAVAAQKLYNRTKNSVQKTFTFRDRAEVPEIPGVNQSYIGFLPAKEFLSLVTDDDGELNHTLFYDNVRDFLGNENKVNSEIKKTLESPDRARFVLMNNGITIIARRLQSVTSRFTIEEFSIVNGCQTTNTLFNCKDNIDNSVIVPLRLIVTQDDNIINSIIRGTNRQSEVKHFLVLSDFAKSIEDFFKAFDSERNLYFERRPCQYDRFPDIDPKRVVKPDSLIKAFGSMFLREPERATRNYKSLEDRVGKDIFVEGHRIEQYYLSAYALFRVDKMYTSRRIEGKFSPARFHLLLAMRLLVNAAPLPRPNSREMKSLCETMCERLWDNTKATELIMRAVSVIEDVAAGNYQRDNIRTQPFTEKVIERCTQLSSK